MRAAIAERLHALPKLVERRQARPSPQRGDLSSHPHLVIPEGRLATPRRSVGGSAVREPLNHPDIVKMDPGLPRITLRVSGLARDDTVDVA